MLEVLKHRKEKDNQECQCGRREPGGLTYHPTGWYCYQCYRRITQTEYKLLGHESLEPSRESVISSLIPSNWSVNDAKQIQSYPAPVPVWGPVQTGSTVGPRRRR